MIRKNHTITDCYVATTTRLVPINFNFRGLRTFTKTLARALISTKKNEVFSNFLNC